METKIIEVQFLQTVKEERIERFTITCDKNNINAQMVEDLSTMITESPGHTEFFLQIIDREHNDHLMLRSGSHQINLNREILQYVESNEALSYHIN